MIANPTISPTDPRRKQRARFTRTLLLAMALAGSLFSGCDNARCEDLRDDLFAQKLIWQECDTSDDCIVVPGNRGDCSGVFSCDFAVNKAYRVVAERRILSLPQETVDCHTCSSPTCVRSNHAVCEARSQLCTVVTGILDGGRPSVIDFIPGDDSPPPPEPPDASPD